MRGIYKIENKINNKIYIGESLDIRRRWEEHLENLKNNSHHSFKLQNDWNEYGEKAFEFNIVSELDDSISSYVDRYVNLIYEYKYINMYDSLNNGYNVENSLKEILNGTKFINDENKDMKILKKYVKKVKNKNIKEKDGIIYLDYFSIDSIRKNTKLSKNKLKGLLYNNNLIVSQGQTYILNENIFNSKDIYNNDRYSNLKFNKITYLKLIKSINSIMESGDVNFVIDKKKNINKDIKQNTKNQKKEIIHNNESKNPIENKEDKLQKFKEYIKKYPQSIEKDINNNILIRQTQCFIHEIESEGYDISLIKGNKIYEILRINGIYNYDEGEKIKNTPTDDYLDKNYFIVKERTYENNDKIFKTTFVTNKGKEFLKKFLLENNYIAI